MENPNLLRISYPRQNKHSDIWKVITFIVIGFLIGVATMIPAMAETKKVYDSSIKQMVIPVETSTELPENAYTEIMKSLTADEEDLLVKILWAEANNQSMEGQRAVIEVILNRVLSDKWPNTIEGVLSQRGQFATWRNRNKSKPTSMQYDALQLVTECDPVLPSTKYVYFDTRGRNGSSKIKLGDHYFGAEK